MNREEMFEQLSRAIELRSSEDSILWTMFGIFWGANIGLLIALFSDGDIPKNAVVGIVVSVVGVALSIAWHLLQQRALGHIERFETLAARLERQLGVPDLQALSGDINTRDFDASLGHTLCSARLVMLWCSGIGAGLWGVSIIIFLCRLG